MILRIVTVFCIYKMHNLTKESVKNVFSKNNQKNPSIRFGCNNGCGAVSQKWIHSVIRLNHRPLRIVR